MDLELLYVLAKGRILDWLHHATLFELMAAGIGFMAVISFLTKKRSPIVGKAKVYGYRSWFEPTLFLQVRFTFSANDIITRAYNKLKDVPFVLRRYDTDITVLPIKYLDEMRLIPRRKLNGKKAQNLVPKWTWTQVMMESDLHVDVLNGKLNPELAKYVEIAHSELDYAWPIDVPRPQNWQLVDVQQSVRMLVARMSAKIFMGEPACRQREWLDVSINFTYDMFMAAFTLRMFPPWMHPLVAHFVPARWRIRKQMAVARKYVGDITREHQDAVAKGDKTEDTLLAWMIDHGKENERKIPEMAARQCVLTLASIHTTSMSISNLLFDLCSHPQWFEVMREEIEQVIAKYGKIGESSLGPKQWLTKLDKMDSLIVECQRMTPPILLNPQRIALVPLTLKDGTKIPQGARIAWAGHYHANDPSVVDRPEEFDPLRSYRKRHMHDGAEFTKHIAGQTNATSLSFGYGSQACPGRYFAIGEIKMILMRLLLEYEFKFAEGETRPAVMYADENVFIDPHAKLLMRLRSVGDEMTK